MCNIYQTHIMANNRGRRNGPCITVLNIVLKNIEQEQFFSYELIQNIP